ncbi:MAG: polyribonucleotide nucleotidyltransferase, partial [Patescibacteria group bacterium]
MKKKEYSLEVGGKKLTAEFNDLADQTDGSVILRYGNTVILATAVIGGEKKGDFFPLTVDYEERFYAAGKLLGGRFVKREGKPSDEAILSGRIVDRTIRPLFDSWIRNEIQVVITVLSIEEDDPDILGVIAASLALGTSQIPWNSPVSAVRVGNLRGEKAGIINPIYATRAKDEYEFDLVACGKDGKINMIEVGSKQTTEEAMIEALNFASTEIEKIQTWQKNIIAEIGKCKEVIPKPELPEELKNIFAEKIEGKMLEAIFSGKPGKTHINDLKGEWEEIVGELYPEDEKTLWLAEDLYEEKVNDLIHSEAIDNARRPDGRKLDEVRPLFTQAGGISPIIHGTGIFYRGGTHIFSALTLGAPSDSQVIDGMETGEVNKRFMHHYNFPPFSSGETGRMGGTNRRMIGHGALAEKALVAVIPHKDIFPYTIRLVSESMASNGSTSMGSVCGSTLALMDGGVPISAPVAGIA